MRACYAQQARRSSEILGGGAPRRRGAGARAGGGLLLRKRRSGPVRAAQARAGEPHLCAWRKRRHSTLVVAPVAAAVPRSGLEW